MKDYEKLSLSITAFLVLVAVCYFVVANSQARYWVVKIELSDNVTVVLASCREYFNHRLNIWPPNRPAIDKLCLEHFYNYSVSDYMIYSEYVNRIRENVGD